MRRRDGLNPALGSLISPEVGLERETQDHVPGVPAGMEPWGKKV